KHDLIDDEEAKKKKLIRIESVLFKKRRGKLRVYLDEELARRIVELAHRRFGHIGSTKMKLQLRPKFYFKNFDQMIEEHCDPCPTCIKNKSRQKKPIGYMSE